MSKNIAISDDVYRKLKREKGDRSFSEVIEDHLQAGARLADVSGQRILDPESAAAARQEIERMSKASLDRIEDEAR